MGYSDWEREYDKEAYYREEMRELNKEEKLERQVKGLIETFKSLGFNVIEHEGLIDYEECVKDDPCGHCERCCE